MKKVIFALSIMVSIVVFVIAIADRGFAQSLRCGQKIVGVGDPTIELLQKCGEPDLKELLKTNGFIIQKWTYNCGSARFMKILTLKGGKIQKIEKADYGSGPARCQ